MKFKKVTTSGATNALVSTVEAGIGFAASNAAVSPVNSLVKNKMASKGIVAVAGLALALTVPNKHVQAIGGGMAAKQIWDLGKEAIAPHVPTTGIIAEALEVQALPPASTDGTAALNRALAGRRGGMGNPQFRLGTPLKTGGPFIAG